MAAVFSAQAKQLISASLLIPTILLGLTSPSPWLHRRAFSSSLKTAVTSPRKTGLTLSSPSAPLQPGCIHWSNAPGEAGQLGCRTKAPRSQSQTNIALQELVTTYFASPGDASWESTGSLAPL